MTARPFTYNPDVNILGTQQFGSLTVGTPANGFESTLLKWWNGPDEDLGYVIAKPDPEGLHQGADGDAAYLGFTRSAIKTEASFLLLANKLSGQDFLTGDTANVWLNANGYWTSYDEDSIPGGTGENNSEGENNNGGGNARSGSWFFYALEGPIQTGPPSQNGQAIFTDNLEDNSGTMSTFNPNQSAGINFFNFKLQDSTGTDYTTQFTTLQTNGGTITVAQNNVYVTYTLQKNMVFILDNPGFAAIDAAYATQTVTAAQSFVSNLPISIAFS